MTLLTIVQDVADEVGVLQPSTLVGNSEETALAFLALAQTAGRMLARKPWTILEREHTFSSVASTATYAIPSDFARMIPDSFWNRTTNRQLVGGITPQRWQFHKSAVAGDVALGDRFRITQDGGVKVVSIDPTPTAVESFAFEYYSTDWCESAALVGQSAWAADTDLTRIPEDIFRLELKWRFLNRMGLSYLEEKNDAEMEIRRALAQEGGRPTIGLANDERGFITHIPDTGAGS